MNIDCPGASTRFPVPHSLPLTSSVPAGRIRKAIVFTNAVQASSMASLVMRAIAARRESKRRWNPCSVRPAFDHFQ